ncbi:MAG TPA: PCYCGC domain-containing protein [Bacillus sp. (in: firmicutes)]|uniref:PCYCGC domain-containing protein n=1 Tax=Bacillus litorisediminis TaxID=2922713 RepID=UPI001FAE38FB|nr:PCYCGC domain-containing protein [Bacillus litorisediminis]HWO75342.1 PCYCGC domain-containing protein [Bacillus sp. (in: firmicutes)]
MLKWKYLNLLIIILLLLTGCVSKAVDQVNNQQPEQETSPDIHEETSGLNELPTFLEGQPEKVVNTYSAVSRFFDLLDLIPAQCGNNGQESSSLDCFVYKLNEDGSVIWTDYATKCETCVDIAAKAIYEFNNGKSIEEIKAEIESTYGNK